MKQDVCTHITRAALYVLLRVLLLSRTIAISVKHLVKHTLTYLFTYLITPRNRVLLENLTGSQLVKKFPAFYGTRRFITAVTSARHLSYPEPARTNP